MSPSEFTFAKEKQNAYVIYRVNGITDVPNDRPSLSRIVNPVKLWATGQIKVRLFV